MGIDHAWRYGRSAAARLRELFGDRLVSVSFVGSVALGGYVEGRSDIDIVVVIDGPATPTDRERVVAALDELVPQCPTRGTELVVYERAAVTDAVDGAAFELNVNLGPAMERRIDTGPGVDDEFWFVIDRAVAHRSADPIAGADPAELFADIPRPWLLRAMRECLSWHRSRPGDPGSAVMSVCRAWPYVDEDVIVSKDDAAMWALTRASAGEADLIRGAIAARRGRSADFSPARVAEFVREVEMRLDSADPAT